MANLKHKEQLEKSRNAQLMEDAKKREDNLNESSQQIKVRGEGGEGGPTGRYWRGGGRKTFSPSLCYTLNIVSYLNNASSYLDSCDRNQP